MSRERHLELDLLGEAWASRVSVSGGFQLPLQDSARGVLPCWAPKASWIPPALWDGSRDCWGAVLCLLSWRPPLLTRQD